ncbi:unnamed protein product, partial [Mesorhabditis spiculigera]
MLYSIERADALSRKRVTLKDFDQIRLDEKGYNKTKDIHYNWYINSIKALMGQLGRQIMKKISYNDKKRLLRCLDRVQDRRDIVSAGKCLIEAKDAYEDMRQRRIEYKDSETSAEVVKEEIQRKDPINVEKHKQNYKKWMGSFRVAAPAAETPRFSTTQQKSIRLNPFKFLKSRKRIRYPTSYGKTKKSSRKELEAKEIERKIQERLAHFKKFFANADSSRRRKIRRQFKDAHRRILYSSKLRKPDSMQFRRRVKRSPYRLIADMVQKSDSQKYTIRNLEQMPALLEARLSPVQKVSKMVMKMVRGENDTEAVGNWTRTYETILKLKKQLDAQAREPGAKVYDLRMYDLVLGRDTPTKGIMERAKDPGFIQETYSLVSRINGKEGRDKNMKFLSPRFAPIMPDKYGITDKRQLSPSILSFYKDDAEDQILPLPKILEAAGLKDKDRAAMMEMIMEVSGTRGIVDDAMKMVSKMNIFGMEGELLSVTKRIMQMFGRLENSFNGRQRKEMKKRGYTFATPHQLEKLHEEQGIRDRKDHGFDYDYYRNLTRAQNEEALWLRIRQIASNSTERLHDATDNTTMTVDSHRRVKRLCLPGCVASPLLNVLNPTVLAPYAFTPIYGLGVLGPVVLSPSIFSPLILNPAVLSPYVLSPGIAMPFILSPYLLSPYVISPLVMAPFILNPPTALS